MVTQISKSDLQSSQDIIEKNRKRNIKFEGMDELFYNLQVAPDELKDQDWFRMVPSTQPSDAVWGAVRTLSSIEPKLSYAPIGLRDEDRITADKYERVLSTLLRTAGRRGKGNYIRQMILSAVLYDLIAVQLDFIPFLLRDESLTDVHRQRLEESMRFGPFALHVRNAKNIHAVHSEWGLERVIMDQIMPAQEAVAFFGNKKLEDAVKEGRSEYVYVMDNMDREIRQITAHPIAEGLVGTSMSQGLQVKNTITIVNKKHGLPFINWIIKGGGSSNEPLPELHHRPLLDSIWKTGQAKTATILRSLLISDVITNYLTPNTKSTTLDGQAPELDQQGPRGNVEMQLGEDFDMLPPSQMDVGMLSLLQLMEDDMQRSTAPRILFGEVPSDISFATYNAGIQAASRTIIPYKELGEESFSEIAAKMLMWSAFAKVDLTAFISSPAEGGGVNGEMYSIKHDEFDTSTIDIDVELVADVPSDRQAKINGAVMMYQNFPVSAEYAMSQVGITDATFVMEQREQEDLNAIAHQNVLSEMSSEFNEQIMAQAREIALQEIAAEQEKLQQQQEEQNGSGQFGPNDSQGQTEGPPQ